MNEEFPIFERQQRIHELIARHAPLQKTLCAIADWVGMMFPEATVSLMSYHPGSHTLNAMPYHCFSATHTHQLQKTYR